MSRWGVKRLNRRQLNKLFKKATVDMCLADGETLGPSELTDSLKRSVVNFSMSDDCKSGTYAIVVACKSAFFQGISHFFKIGETVSILSKSCDYGKTFHCERASGNRLRQSLLANELMVHKSYMQRG